MNKAPQSFSRKKTLVFSLIIIVFFLGIAETASYYFIRNFAETGAYGDRVLQNNFHPFLGWEHAPNARLQTTKTYSKQKTAIDTDDRGLSITPLNFPNPQLHIAVTGGSTMFGVGATSNATTVPSLIEKEIYERLGIEAEVHNLGVRGYQSFQEMLKLREFLMNQRLDLVLAISGRNDSSIALRQPEQKYAMMSRHVYLNAVPLVRQAEQQKPIMLNIDGYVRSVSYFADLVFRGIRRMGGWTGLEVADESGSADNRDIFANVKERAKATLLHYSMMKTVANESGAEFKFMLQPTLYSWKHYDKDKFPHIPKGVPYNDVYEVRFYHEILEQGHSLPVYDMTGVLDELTEPPFIDNSHYTDQGGAALASAVVDALESDLRALMSRTSK